MSFCSRNAQIIYFTICLFIAKTIAFRSSHYKG